jgi:TRAP-type uncharacterized transport system substrate-binding protein
MNSKKESDTGSLPYKVPAMDNHSEIKSYNFMMPLIKILNKYLYDVGPLFLRPVMQRPL